MTHMRRTEVAAERWQVSARAGCLRMKAGLIMLMLRCAYAGGVGIVRWRLEIEQRQPREGQGVRRRHPAHASA